MHISAQSFRAGGGDGFSSALSGMPEPLWRKAARYTVSVAIMAAVSIGVGIGGLVPEIPIEITIMMG